MIIDVNNIETKSGRSVPEYGKESNKEREGYPAYCTYIPEGMGKEYEEKIIKYLEVWGTKLEKTLYVGPWDIRDPSAIQLMRETGVKKRPAIILSDKDIKQFKKDSKEDSLMIILNEPGLIKDVEKLTETLSTLLDLIWIEDKKNAAKKALKEQQIAKIKSLLKPFGKILSKVKIRFFHDGALMTVDTST